MASQDEIFTVRLSIKDPQGIIGFKDVSELTDLPSAPLSQTAYKVLSTGNYYTTTKTEGAAVTDYSIEELRISDDSLSLLIDAHSVSGAILRAIDSIIVTIINEMAYVKSNSAGAESTDYQTLSDILAAYKAIKVLYSDQNDSDDNNNSGRYMGSRQPVIGGGNL